MEDGFTKGYPKVLLQAEGAALLGAILWSYSRLGLPWTWFRVVGILFIPDIGMLGYLVNNNIGAVTYNALHTQTPAIVLLCAAWARDDKLLMGLALLWLGHTALDRMLGIGLKYGTGFACTHLGSGKS